MAVRPVARKNVHRGTLKRTTKRLLSARRIRCFCSSSLSVSVGTEIELGEVRPYASLGFVSCGSEAHRLLSP